MRALFQLQSHALMAALAQADADLAGKGGGYYDSMKLGSASPATDDRELAARLWTISEKLTGAKITF